MPDRKADRHKNPMIPFRPEMDQRAWLRQHAAATGRAVNAILRQALTEYRNRHEQQHTQGEDHD